MAISDDDYSRVVLAQQFAETPHLDPSGTSWLPFPFWINGVFMMVFGATLEVARACALFLSLAGGGLLFWAILSTGLALPLTSAITLSCLLLPSSLWLGVATVPEFPTAVLVTVAALSLTAPVRSAARVIGALSLSAATASRYETWPVAIVFFLWCCYDELRLPLDSRSRASGTPPAMTTVLSVAFPCLWLLHGAVAHSDPLFFVKRVADYKRALGDDLPDILALFSGYPAALVSSEPLPLTLVAIICMSLALLKWTKIDGAALATNTQILLVRAGSVILALLVFLIVGDAQGGAPTHHPERALLSFWLILLVAAGHLIATRMRPKLASLVFVVLLCGSHYLRPLTGRIRESRNRSAEEAIGRHLRALPKHTPVALWTDDFGYFAVMAAASHPSRFSVLADHDPRKQSAQPSLANWFQVPDHCLLVVSRTRDTLGSQLVSSQGQLELRRAQSCTE